LSFFVFRKGDYKFFFKWDLPGPKGGKDFCHIFRPLTTSAHNDLFIPVVGHSYGNHFPGIHQHGNVTPFAVDPILFELVNYLANSPIGQ